jgi:hypothetical protein
MLALAVLVCLAAAVWGQTVRTIADDLDVDAYDCTLELLPAANISGENLCIVRLETDGIAGLSLVLGTRAAILTVAGTKEPLAQADGIVAGAQNSIAIFRRGGWLGIQRNGAWIFRGNAPRGPGGTVTVGYVVGWTVLNSRAQRLEPVLFADDFMRTANEPGPWTPQNGTWTLRSVWDFQPKGNTRRFEFAHSAQNPFFWAGSVPRGSALCTAGAPYWEDYTLGASVCPAADGAVGLLVNMPNPRNGILVRWSPVNDRSADGNRLQVFQLRDGQRTLLGDAPGGSLPGQWYRLEVATHFSGALAVRVDGRECLRLENVSPSRGGIGLYVEGNGGTFDDITAYGDGVRQDLIAEQLLARLNQRFRDDNNGMKTWANAGNDWRVVPDTNGLRVHRLDFSGDHWLTLGATPRGTGRVVMALNSDGVDPNSGFQAIIEHRPTGTDYLLYRNGAPLDHATGAALTSGETYTFRLRREGDRLWLEQDGRRVAGATGVAPLAGTHPVYGAAGEVAITQDGLVLGRGIFDDVFTEAPVSWIGAGSWMPTVRWSCSPEWSFMGGWSHGDAALWHKTRVTGDQTFQAFLGILMEYPRERDIYPARYRDLAITICGDGSNPRSGYAGIFGASDEKGTPNRRTVLLRNGVVVASAPLVVPGYNVVTHRAWHELLLRKRGAAVEFWVNGRQVLTYTDPEPITGGVPAVWTSNGGVILSRARLTSTLPPVPRTEPRVALDEPWYPEWANVGQPVTLAFPGSCATSGKPVILETVAHRGAADLAVNARAVTITPTAAGPLWAGVIATDGTWRSPEFHYVLPIFTPTLGRDDSHALLLYSFTEGRGNLVYDHGNGKPLTLTLPPNAQWLPGQGVSLNNAEMPARTGAADKLGALAATNAGTIECWVSTATIHPVDNRGTLLAWENFGQWNFAFGHAAENLMFTPNEVRFLAISNSWAVLTTTFRTGLQHLVVTWQGNTAVGYVNGRPVGTIGLALNPSDWNTTFPLLLGMHGDRKDHYLGAYYLLAIHDRALPAAQVLRHFQAGPSAKSAG